MCKIRPDDILMATNLKIHFHIKGNFIHDAPQCHGRYLRYTIHKHFLLMITAFQKQTNLLVHHAHCHSSSKVSFGLDNSFQAYRCWQFQFDYRFIVFFIVYQSYNWEALVECVKGFSKLFQSHEHSQAKGYLNYTITKGLHAPRGHASLSIHLRNHRATSSQLTLYLLWFLNVNRHCLKAT